MSPNPLNTHDKQTAEILALRAVVLTLTSFYKVDKNFAVQIVQKYPLIAEPMIQDSIRAEAINILGDLISQS